MDDNWISERVHELIKQKKEYDRRDRTKEELLEVIDDLVRQYGHYIVKEDGLYLWACGISAMEQAFGALKWDDPHAVPEEECEYDGCHRQATCGMDKKQLCADHFSVMWKERREKDGLRYPH